MFKLLYRYIIQSIIYNYKSNNNNNINKNLNNVFKLKK